MISMPALPTRGEEKKKGRKGYLYIHIYISLLYMVKKEKGKKKVIMHGAVVFSPVRGLKEGKKRKEEGRRKGKLSIFLSAPF